MVIAIKEEINMYNNQTNYTCSQVCGKFKDFDTAVTELGITNDWQMLTNDNQIQDYFLEEIKENGITVWNSYNLINLDEFNEGKFSVDIGADPYTIRS